MATLASRLISWHTDSIRKGQAEWISGPLFLFVFVLGMVSRNTGYLFWLFWALPTILTGPLIIFLRRMARDCLALGENRTKSEIISYILATTFMLLGYLALVTLAVTMTF